MNMFIRNKFIGKIITLALLTRVIYAIIIWTPYFKSPHKSMSNMYVRSAYGIILNKGYVQFEPSSKAYKELYKNVITALKKDWTYTISDTLKISNKGVYFETLHPPGWSVIGAYASKTMRIPVWYTMQIITILFDIIALFILFKTLTLVKIPNRIIQLSIILYALFPPIIYNTVNVRPEGFMPFFIISITFYFIKYYQSKKIKYLIYSAIIAGIMGYFRPDYFLFAPFLCLLFTKDLLSNFNIKKLFFYIARPIFITIITLLVLSPWAIRNKQKFDSYIFTSSGAGCTLITGLGTYPNPWGFGPSDLDRHKEAIENGFSGAFDVKANAYFKEKFFKAIQDSPKSYFRILLNRFKQPIAPPYSWGIKRSKNISYTKFRTKGKSILSKPIILVKNYWSEIISAGLMFLANLGILLFFYQERNKNIFSWIILLAYCYSVLIHILTHMAPYYLLPTIFTQIFGLSYIIYYSKHVYKKNN